MVSPTLFFKESKDSLIGGAETYAINLSFAMSKLKHRITLITASANQNSTTFINDYLQVKSLKSSKTLGYGGNDIFSRQVFNSLCGENYDVIHLHQLFSGFNVSANLLAKLRGIPCFSTDHGGGSIFYRAFPQFCAALPDFFIAVSDYSLRYLHSLAPKKKSFVAYGGVDTNIFKPDLKVDTLRKELNLGDCKVVLCVGRLLSCKGYDIAIKAAYNLPINTKLVIVGPIIDQQYYNYLKHLAVPLGDRVIFVGHVRDDDLPRYYNLCDIFVRSSVNDDCFGRHYNFPELLGLVKFEAMACGKPVVVSDVGGLPEQVICGQHGYIVKAGSDIELAKALNTLLSDDDLCRKMGQQSLRFVQTNFSWYNVAKKVIDFYKVSLRD